MAMCYCAFDQLPQTGLTQAVSSGVNRRQRFFNRALAIVIEQLVFRMNHFQVVCKFTHFAKDTDELAVVELFGLLLIKIEKTQG